MDMRASRISWQDYFMGIAALVAERSTCLRRKVGAVAVKDRRILATGYNGAPKGVAHCLDVGCLREQLGIPSGERHEQLRSCSWRTKCNYSSRQLRGIFRRGGFVLYPQALFYLCENVGKRGNKDDHNRPRLPG